MSDYDDVRGGDQGPEAAVPQAPRPVACPRCRGVFEGNPDVCPHCGLAKADIPTLRAQAPEPVASPADALASSPAASPPAPAEPGTAAAPILEPAEPEERSQRRRPVRLLAAGAVVLLAAAGVGWWATNGGVEEDPCADFRKELQQVQAADHPNSREERRAVAEVVGRAHDSDCDLGNDLDDSGAVVADV